MRGAIILSLLATAYATFTCMNQKNQPVDWWMVYKMPIVKDNTTAGINDGLGFYYMDARSNGKWEPSPKTLNDKDQAIAYTLQWFYDRILDPWVFHVMYNDDPYEYHDDDSYETITNRVNNGDEHTTSTKFGHTKGTIVFDKVSGFWIVHSVPRFPPPHKYAYPPSGTIYGQTMLCMTMLYPELGKIGTQLYYNRPNIYHSFLPTEMAVAYPDLAKAIAQEYSTDKSSVIDLKSRGGVTFKSFAKSKYFDQDLYDGLVAPTLKTDLTVESWRRGGLIALECGLTYKTNDALSIKDFAIFERRWNNLCQLKASVERV
ncbi:hypothetical protein WR25_14548 [Diploscapter pachys]|uniref:Uncharacterized protein n=1 Tax=Diploscapter pachys TaxID=2018661 RepID=A0A2A2L4U3_9BILA|nr:hypothetical protein WR25_14548 [Diploscapter pachys]